MRTNILELMSFSIVISVIIAIYRFNKIDKTFYPFIGLQVFGLIAEISTNYVTHYFKSNAISTNLFSIVESILLLWQFRKWGLLKNKKWYVLLHIAVAVSWLSEMIYFKTLHHFYSAFYIFYSFIIVLLSIQMLNRLLISVTSILFKNPVFLICAGFVIFFTYNIIVEVFYLFEISEAPAFSANIYIILSVINFIVNIVYALAILWIPPKQKFILPSSSLR